MRLIPLKSTQLPDNAPLSSVSPALLIVTLSALLSLSGAMSGCEDNPPSGASSSSQCMFHTDCELPDRCLDGVCRLECRVSTDCETGQRCYEGVCYSRPATCTQDEECAPFSELCHPTRGYCTPPGEINTSSGGVESSNAGSSAGQSAWSQGGASGGDSSSNGGSTATPMGGQEPPQGADPMTGGTSQTAGIVPPMGGDPSPGGTSTGGAEVMLGVGVYGDPCQCPTDCATGFCVQNKMRRMRTCSMGCERDNECPGVDTCLQAQVQASGGMCPDGTGLLPPPGTVVGVCAPNETGVPCEQPTQCTAGICLSPPSPVDWISPQSVCTVQCSGSDKCPPGYTCGAVGGVSGTVCTPVAAVNACPDGLYTSCGEVCPLRPGVQEAEVAICLTGSAAGTGGYCTCSCQTAGDCPEGFGCNLGGGLVSEDPTRPGVCLPISGYMCPLSPEPEQCLSMICNGDSGSRYEDYCTTVCTNNADCPAQFNCQRTPEGVSVCVPQDE